MPLPVRPHVLLALASAARGGDLLGPDDRGVRLLQPFDASGERLVFHSGELSPETFTGAGCRPGPLRVRTYEGRHLTDPGTYTLQVANASGMVVVTP